MTLALSAHGTRADCESSIPALIPDPYGGAPAWVAAEIAVESGQLRPGLLGSRLDDLRELARRNGELAHGLPDRPCSLFKGESPAEHFEPADTLDALTQYGKAIVSGRVSAVREGFWYGLPASLVELDAEWLKGEPPDGRTYFLYPFARIETAEGPICSKPVGSFLPPQVGDRLMVFSYGVPFRFEGNRVVGVEIARGLVHERAGERPRVPAALQGLVPNAGSAVDRIRSAARTSIDASRRRH